MNAEPTEAHNRSGAGPTPESTIPEGTWRSLLVPFGPSVALDLLLGACVVATALDALPDPSRGRTARLLRRAAFAGALLPWAYLLIGRPWHLRWGATDEEARKRLPGDELVPRPVVETIRALTINASAKEIWPWMVQMGAGRGGLYSYDWLENLAGLGIHSVDRIIPELQDLKEGDVFPLDASSGTGPTVAELVPERAIVLHFLDARAGRSVLSWAYILDPVDEGTTRLIFRFKLDVNPRPLWGLVYALLIDIPHFVMERKMMLGIKERAERAQATRVVREERTERIPRLQREIVINRPVEEVFDFVTDARNEPRYNSRILSTEKTTPGPIGRGTHFVLVSKAMGRRMAVEYEITAYERPRLMTSRTIGGLPLMDVESTETFEAITDGTRMRWEWEVKPRGAAGRLMTPVLARMLGQRLEVAFTNIKRVLEGEAAAVRMNDRRDR